MLGISTRCAPEEYSLDQAVRAMADLPVEAFALHRPPTPAEVAGLVRVRVVAVFGEDAAVGNTLLVVEGGVVGEDRERSLDELCRRLHAMRDGPVALRTRQDADHHPAPEEIALVASAVRHVGYWHDAGRGGEEFLEAAGRHIRGASFHPLLQDDLTALRDVLSGGAPAIVDCAPGTPKSELREAIRRARGVFPE